ncbi:SGNH/GDSL hydrolase family protein [Teredinibacter haidensis]|uniref:SGNH/GDSL hydrolase family protein n=1 Tax=Teredinibacter haidensis TaxID=2731755 RepID=UPI001587F90B|nr:SGNH/GDSL hydrolase family protein [Teredinibacter haidensis]
MPTDLTPPTDANIQQLGRMQIDKYGSATFGYPGTGFRFRTTSTEVSATLKSTGEESYMAVRVDGGQPARIKLPTDKQEITIFSQESSQPREIEFIYHSETWQGIVSLYGFRLADGRLLTAAARPEKRLLVVGDSVTCGAGANRDGNEDCGMNNRWWNAHKSYGWLTGEALDAQVQLVCYGGRGLIRSWNGARDELNAPDYYQLTIAENNAEKWQQSRFPADLIVVSLGTNDFSLGIGALPTEEEFAPAYVSFVQTLLQDHPKADIILTDGAIVNDNDPERPQRTVLRSYLQQTRKLVDSERVHVFNASHFPGDSCDAHPTGPQHKMMSEELVAFIRRELN